MLRNRTVLIGLAALLLLGLRFLPLQPGSGPGAPASNPATSRPAAVGTPGAGGQPTPTVQPAVIDPGRLDEQLSPFLVLRAAAVKRGAPLAVSGQSFRPFQELAISIQRDGEETAVELGTVTTDKNGFLPDVSLPLPEGLGPGAYTVIATPVLGGPSVDASLRVESDQAWGRLTSQAAKPNEAVGYEGGGFIPGESVTVHLDNLNTEPAATVDASAMGEVSGVFRVPLADEGNHTVVFYGDQSRMPVVADLFVLGFSPWVVLDNYSPMPEQSVGFAGSDFTPGEKVYVFLNSMDSGPVVVVQVDQDGRFEAAGALPLGPEVKGTHTLIFVGDRSQTTSEAEFTVQPYPASLQLTVYAGPPGSEVAFIGNGFARGEKVDAYWGELGRGSHIATFRADQKGTFSGAGSFRVPRDTRAGEFVLSVVGQVSGAEASVTFSVLPITPWGEVKPDRSGRAVVLGHGFAAGEEVELTVGQAAGEPSGTTEADEDGNAQFPPLEIPTAGADPTLIVMRGRDSGAEATVEFYGSPEQGEMPPADASGTPVPGQGETPGADDRGSLEFEPAATPTESP